ncbi:protein FAR-RED IMPAIRED RESPONSE 1-like [Cornus florida]|uniref:protein FAR-RED IMPAIRED RESPONSE 1-like n=1 Tax=Cornus florida TaxID=4283 RepID=UPI00289EFC2C|nr:protein FAR-RED IMPAIRED RESPONSE 1-like [Cornus florida]
MNAFFDGYVHSKTSLKQFVEQYDNALKSKDELKGLVYCNTSLIKREKYTSTFEVREQKFGTGGVFWKEVTYEVFYNAIECEVRCLCHLFEFRGILCRHAISVIMQEKVYEVPSHYILERWRKDIKRGYTFVKKNYDDFSNSEQRQRNNILRPLLYELQELGVESDEKCEFLLKQLKETKKKLLSFDSGCFNSQESVICQPANECSSMIHELSGSQKKVLTPIKAKTKGRPPSKRIQSVIEKTVKKGKKALKGKQKGQLDQNDLQVQKRRKALQSIPSVVNDVVPPTISPTASKFLDKMATQEIHAVIELLIS